MSDEIERLLANRRRMETRRRKEDQAFRQEVSDALVTAYKVDPRRKVQIGLGRDSDVVRRQRRRKSN